MSANHFDQTALAVSKAVTITGGTTAVIGGLTLYGHLSAITAASLLSLSKVDCTCQRSIKNE